MHLILVRFPNLYFGSIQYSWGTWLGQNPVSDIVEQPDEPFVHTPHCWSETIREKSAEISNETASHCYQISLKGNILSIAHQVALHNYKIQLHNASDSISKDCSTSLWETFRLVQKAAKNEEGMIDYEGGGFNFQEPKKSPWFIFKWSLQKPFISFLSFCVQKKSLSWFFVILFMFLL